MATNGVAELARKKWQSSGLTDTQAKQLKMRALDKGEVTKLAANFKPASALFIPYFSPEGKLTQFYRVRYLEEPFGFKSAKPQRYDQPAKSLNEVYLPPLLKRTWKDVFADVTETIYITEGELKAAAACSIGLACVGLGGVDLWRAQKRHLDLLPALADAKWQGRPVVIVYDSDAATNPNVVRAQRQLARMLLSRGAIPSVAALPPRSDGKKQGLDDFLVAAGDGALREVLAGAQLFLNAEALWEMNEEVVYIKDPGHIVVKETGQLLKPGDFVAHAFANRTFMEELGEGKRKQRKTAQMWLEWPHRHELACMTYAPGQPRIYQNQWNTWEGWGCEPKKGDIGPWRALLDYIFKDQAEARRWFERWCAYPLQHPGTKLFTSVLIWGVHHGTGKTLIGYTLRNIYGSNASEVTDDDLHGNFNEWAKHKQFIIGDEITGSDKRADADRLKRLVTQESVRINAKYLPSYVIPDCTNYYLTANNPATLFLEDTDRRAFVHEIVGAPLPLDFYREYDAWLKGGGSSALFHHLLELDLGDFSPTAPALVTASKRRMIVDNKSDIGSWVLGLREDTEVSLRVLGDSVAARVALVSGANLLRCYDPTGERRVTVNGLGRELKRAGFRQANEGSPIRTSHGLQRLWIVRDEEKWAKATPKACAMHYDETYGNGRKF